MSITELKNMEKMIFACQKCTKEHCYKQCTNYLPPEELLRLVDLAVIQLMEQEGKK